MINIKKCKLLVPRMELLGFIVFNASWQLGPKTLSKYLDVKLPRTIKQLQGVLGLLNFSSIFVPGYKTLVAPIENLLSKHSKRKWTARCTQALNTLIKIVFARLTFKVFDPARVLRMHVGVADDVCTVVFSQKHGVQYWPVAMSSRKLLETEKRLLDIEQLIVVSSWACRKFSQLALNAI